MHNNIMTAGSRDHTPMLATGRYSQWQSRLLRYIDTRPNGDALRKCILNGPYIPTNVVVQAVAVTGDSPAILEPGRMILESVEDGPLPCLALFLNYGGSGDGEGPLPIGF
nr:hypothetical protein [Tanacetum cinerariifolium]